MTPAVITTFISSVIGLIVIALGFFVRNFIEGLKSSIDALNLTIKEMGKTMLAMERRQDTHDRTIEDHGLAILHLHRMRCSSSECPHRKDDDPGTNPFLLREGAR